MPEGTEQPKVFVSHASEDKERFVLAFATKLRARGVDAWVDRWEMYPGDSLVGKIFDEGLKNARAVIIVLSQNSVNKRWVKEEIDASFVKKVNEGSLLIPVVLEECPIPECLKHTVWEPINDLERYDEALDRIVSAIFNVRIKPPIGASPHYRTSELPEITGLSAIDTLVLKHFGDAAVRDDDTLAVATENIWSEVAKLEVSREDFLDSLTILTSERLLKPSPVIAPIPHEFSITFAGFDRYAHAFLPTYSAVIAAVVSAIVNQQIYDLKDLVQCIPAQPVVIRHVLDALERKGLVQLRKALFGYLVVESVSPRLKRLLRSS